MPITAWDRFGHVGVVCYTGYINRFSRLEEELSRVGISDYQTYWDFPSPYKEALKSKITKTSFVAKNGAFSIAMNHYRAIATAYHLGKSSVLVMEDDICFLKDLKVLQEVIYDLPDDFDIAMLDHNKPSAMPVREYVGQFDKSRKISRHWHSFDCLTSSGCYALSRRGMESILSKMEMPAKGQAKLFHNDYYLRRSVAGTSLNLYAANPTPAMQIEYENRHCRKMWLYYAIHEEIGIRKDMFSGF